jgi:hypothetical protein
MLRQQPLGVFYCNVYFIALMLLMIVFFSFGTDAVAPIDRLGDATFP